MDEYVEDKINEIGGKIDTVISITKAILSSILGTEEFTNKDTFNFVYLLEEKMDDLKNAHNILIEDLHI